METDQRRLHHANLLLGSPQEAEIYLRNLSRDLGIELANSPDFLVIRAETFGIDEARELKILSTRKPISGSKIFLIIPTRLTLEAQNALLKTFEDPSPDTYFFVAVSEEGIIIPTLRSRMEILRLSGENTYISEDAKEFLSLSLKERLLFAGRFTERKKNLNLFLDDLLLVLRKESGNEKLLESVYSVRRLVRDTGAPSRLVIEHLALVL